MAQAQPAAASQALLEHSGGMDTSVRPGDDFDAYANGGWIKATEIPADAGRWSMYNVMKLDTKERVTKLILGVAAQPKGSDARKVADFYAAYLDAQAIEAKGIAPIKPMLDAIAAVQDKAALTRLLGRAIRSEIDPAFSIATPDLFGLWVGAGFHGEKNYAAFLVQGGIGLPGRDYYVNPSPRMQAIRTSYQAYIAQMLALAGFDRSTERAQAVMQLETAIAQRHATQEDSDDDHKADNTWVRDDFARKAPGMDWAAFFDAAGLAKQKSFIVWHPDAVAGEAALLASSPLEAWKDAMRFHAIDRYADVLPKAFADASFAFRGAELSGAGKQGLRAARALDAVYRGMPEAVGKIYVARYFPAEHKARAQKLINNVIAASGKRLEALTWMEPATKADALAKLRTLYFAVGYPDQWTSYAGLVVDPLDAVGNLERASAWNYKNAVAKLDRPVSAADAWFMAPHVVGARSQPEQNAYIIPAGFLQAPKFDPDASDAANYGAIGAIAGHEVNHFVDITNPGAEYDSKMHLRDWWTAKDLDQFKAVAQPLIDQYSSYRPYPDLAVNGKQVFTESMADLAGLAAAFDAHRKALGSKVNDKAFVRQQDRQFFIGFAQSWRSKSTQSAERALLAGDTHAPDRYRIATVRNLDAWYDAFDVQPGQTLYLEPKARVRIW